MLKQHRTPWLGKESNQSVWYIYWRDPVWRRCRRCSTGTYDRQEAEVALGKFLIERTADIALERIQPPESYLIATALQLYIKERGKEIRNLDYAMRAAKSLIKFFGPRAMVSCITPPVLKRYEHERIRRPRVLTKKEGLVFVKDIRPVTKGTISRELSVLASALNHAVKYRRLTIAPPIYKPTTGGVRKRFLNKDELQSLLASCSAPHIKLFVVLAINTGGRKSALLDLGEIAGFHTRSLLPTCFCNDIAKRFRKSKYRKARTDGVPGYEIGVTSYGKPPRDVANIAYTYEGIFRDLIGGVTNPITTFYRAFAIEGKRRGLTVRPAVIESQPLPPLRIAQWTKAAGDHKYLLSLHDDVAPLFAAINNGCEIQRVVRLVALNFYIASRPGSGQLVAHDWQPCPSDRERLGVGDTGYLHTKPP